MKKIGIWILVILAILFCIVKGVEWRIESIFHDRINADPDRAYNITYSYFDLHSFLKSIKLKDVSIDPLNTETGTIITGKVDYATLNGLVWRDLLFDKKLNINEIAFKQPLFEVTLSTDTCKKTSGKGFQVLFGDLLSGISLNSFHIQDGSIAILDPISKAIKGEVKRINILATEIETDSLKFTYLIPFQMGNLKVDIDSLSFQPNDYTHIRLDRFRYKLMDKSILLNNFSLSYSIDWLEVSKQVGVQTDIIELNVKEIGIHKIEPSNNFYTQLEIDAQKVLINELDIKLHRNKNFSRPPDVVKPMFQGIINSIPIAVLIDSIQISNSSVTYAELVLNKKESGSIKIQQINGNITDLTNMPHQQKDRAKLNAKLSASLRNKTALDVELSVPYTNSTFLLDLDVGEMDVTDLNPTLKPLTGVEMVSGQISRIKLQMKAGPIHSQNHLVLDYSDLQIKVINDKNKTKKKVLLSAIANTAIRANNLPNQDKYLVANYQTERNIYRSPVHYIIHGLMNGFTRIIPGKGVQKMMNKNDKKGKKKNK